MRDNAIFRRTSESATLEKIAKCRNGSTSKSLPANGLVTQRTRFSWNATSGNVEEATGLIENLFKLDGSEHAESFESAVKAFFAGYEALCTPLDLLYGVEQFVKHHDNLDSISARLLQFFTCWVDEGSAKYVRKPLLELSCQPSLPNSVSNKLKLLLLKNKSEPKNAVEEVARDERYLFLKQTKPSVLASTITKIEYDIWKTIDVCELRNRAWQTDEKHRVAPNVTELIERFNSMSLWVAECVLERKRAEERALLIDAFVNLAQKLYELNNFNGMMEILSGLNRNAVQRLKQTWKVYKKSYSSAPIFNKLDKLMEPARNFQSYRRHLESVLKKSETSFVLPHVAVLLKDFSVADEVNPKVVEGRFSLERALIIGKLVLEFKTLQERRFEASCREDVLLYLKKGLSTSLNDEEQYNLSTQLEPPASLVPVDDVLTIDAASETGGPHSDEGLSWTDVPVFQWTCSMLLAWLTHNGMDVHRPFFQKEEIHGIKLLSLSNETLQANVSVLGHRKKIQSLINEGFSNVSELLQFHPLRSWSPNLVARFLASHGLANVEAIILGHNVDGKAFKALTDAKLCEMEVVALGHRKKVLSLVAKVNHPATWDVTQVKKWIQQLDLDDTYAELFATNSINGKELLELTKGDLAAKLNIPIHGHRLAIMKAIQELKTT